MNHSLKTQESNRDLSADKKQKILLILGLACTAAVLVFFAVMIASTSVNQRKEPPPLPLPTESTEMASQSSETEETTSFTTESCHNDEISTEINEYDSSFPPPDTTQEPITTTPVTAPVTTERQTSERTTLPPEPPQTTAPPPIANPIVLLDSVPYISQNRYYPNGCESVSTVMALQYMGIDLTVDRFILHYLDMGATPVKGGIGPDPAEVFCGDPRKSSGWGCYAPVIVKALEKFLNRKAYTIASSTEKTLPQLCEEYLDKGIPVICWATLNMRTYNGAAAYAHWTTPEGKNISYHQNLHCLLLVGYDENFYYFHDPKVQGAYGNGATAYSRAKAERAFEILGRQSIAVFPFAEDIPSETVTTKPPETLPSEGSEKLPSSDGSSEATDLPTETEDSYDPSEETLPITESVTESCRESDLGDSSSHS